MPRGVPNQVILPDITSFISKNVSNNVDNQVTKREPFADNLASPYVPFFALFKGTGFTISNANKTVRVYSHMYYTGNYTANGYTNIYYAFRGNLRGAKVSRNETVQVSKGMIQHSSFDITTGEHINKVVVLLAVKSSEIFNLSTNENGQFTDYSKFTCFIHHDFTTDPLYKSMFAKLNKEMFPVFREKGIDLIYTNDIQKWCYKSTDVSPKIKSIPELKEYTNNFNHYLHGTQPTRQLTG